MIRIRASSIWITWPIDFSSSSFAPSFLEEAAIQKVRKFVRYRIVRARAEDRLAEPGLQHSPPGDAGTARRGMKTVSPVFQPKQWAEKEARKTIENRT